MEVLKCYHREYHEIPVVSDNVHYARSTTYTHYLNLKQLFSLQTTEKELKHLGFE